ncbi:MAG: hypothetical protein KA515_01075 [Candidatus Pacebacteria bacterium]|nr:hypothetical protein [Candidatus Paceibacterota bacterium]
MNNETVGFVVSFLGGLVCNRILFFVVPVYFKKPLTRSITKLGWHHLHWGIIMILFSAVFLVLFGKNLSVIILLGVGLGLVMDLFIPSLQLKTNREEELAIYSDSLFPTILLGLSIVAIIVLLSFFVS